MHNLLGLIGSSLSVQEKTWPTVAAGWQLWIPAHAINFGFVPSSMRVLYVNVVAVRYPLNMLHLRTLSSVDAPCACWSLTGSTYIWPMNDQSDTCRWFAEGFVNRAFASVLCAFPHFKRGQQICLITRTVACRLHGPTSCRKQLREETKTELRRKCLHDEFERV